MANQSKHSLLTALAAVLFLISFVSPVNAETRYVQPDAEEILIVTRIRPDGVRVTDTIVGVEAVRTGKLLFNESDHPLNVSEAYAERARKMRRFMCGLELGSGLDLSSTDQSTFNADILVGYRHKAIQLIGFSFGVHKSLGKRDSFLPLQVVFRTGFSSRPTLLFMHTSAGYSFNTFSSSKMFGDVILTAGCGINLVNKPRFQSNMMLAIGFRHLNERHREMTSIDKPNLAFAQISFGISM